MNRDRQDYYDLLGVAPDAAQDEIKQAFRARARTVHPDVSPDPDAKDRFAELARAYSVLANPESRILYDRYGYLGAGNGGFDAPSDARGASSPIPHGDVVELRIRPFEAARGSRRRVRVARLGRCSSCGGSGAAAGASARECSACGGDGRMRTSSSVGETRLLQLETCLACAGRGVVAERPCRRCHGFGEVREERVLEVEVPPGAEDGGVIRAGRSDGDGEAAGARDVYVRLRIVHERDSRLVRVLAVAALGIAVVLFAILYLVPEALFDAI